MLWARENGYVVFTHDLDFGILLAHSKEGKPSVLQVRAQDVSPRHLGSYVIRALRAHAPALESGALLTIDESRSRVRILPIQVAEGKTIGNPHLRWFAEATGMRLCVATTPSDGKRNEDRSQPPC